MKALRFDAPRDGDARAAVKLRAFAVAVAALAAVAPSEAAERSGKEVVDASCVACHGSGKNGAPKIGDAKAWGPLASRGLSALGKSALAGVRNMPPHGGNPGFSDTEIERAITYMVNQSGGHWNEPVSRTALPKARSGEEVVRAVCAECHATGKGSAPKIGDRQAWLPRVSPGLDVVVASAIKGHGGMPARGGKADLTDAEVKGAIVYMMTPPK